LRTFLRMSNDAHWTRPSLSPRPARPAICWISCSYSSTSYPLKFRRLMPAKMIFFMFRFNPIPIAFVATKYGAILALNFRAYSFLHSGGSLPYTIAIFDTLFPSSSKHYSSISSSYDWLCFFLLSSSSFIFFRRLCNVYTENSIMQSPYSILLI
jgi:hypothetical protein